MSPFLTALDSRARVKGSRDPLGIQPIWTRFGRHVVWNLTTVSKSVRDFTTLLLGLHFAERISMGVAAGAGGAADTAGERAGASVELATFLKWEQLAAYARIHVNNEAGVRGTDRVRRNLSQGRRVTLSPASEHQILGNQKIYGIWGLYTVSARSSGLIDSDPPRLTPPAREMIDQHYLPLLGQYGFRDVRKIERRLSRSKLSLEVDGRDSALVKAVAKLLSPVLRKRERDFYRDHLLHGGPEDGTRGTRGLQSELAGLLEETLDQEEFRFSPIVVGQLAREARARDGEQSRLAYHLDRIRLCETLVAPASALFQFLLSWNGCTMDEVVKEVVVGWGRRLEHIDLDGLRALQGEIGDAFRDADAGARWIRIAEAFATGDYRVVVKLLLEQNADVMRSRGGSPWIEEHKGKLKVRFRDETGFLPPLEDLPTLWFFPYFLNSLRAVAMTIGRV